MIRRQPNIRLRTAIKKAGYSQRSLGKECGLHEVQISAYVTGRIVPLQRDKLIISAALGIPISSLF